MKEANRKKEFDDLLDKQGTYSKGSNLVYGKLQMREYLQSENLNINQKKLIFKIRTRMFFVKENYKLGKNKNMNCPCCNKSEDTQNHLINCEKITKSNVDSSEFSSLFGNNVEKISGMIGKFEDIINQRTEIIDDLKQTNDLIDDMLEDDD